MRVYTPGNIYGQPQRVVTPLGRQRTTAVVTPNIGPQRQQMMRAGGATTAIPNWVLYLVGGAIIAKILS